MKYPVSNYVQRMRSQEKMVLHLMNWIDHLRTKVRIELFTHHLDYDLPLPRSNIKFQKNYSLPLLITPASCPRIGSLKFGPSNDDLKCVWHARSYHTIVFRWINLDTINGISIFKPLLGSIVSIADVEPNTNIIRMPLSNSLSVTTWDILSVISILSLSPLEDIEIIFENILRLALKSRISLIQSYY